jgi:hypothetical protein
LWLVEKSHQTRFVISFEFLKTFPIRKGLEVWKRRTLILNVFKLNIKPSFENFLIGSLPRIESHRLIVGSLILVLVRFDFWRPFLMAQQWTSCFQKTAVHGTHQWCAPFLKRTLRIKFYRSRSAGVVEKILPPGLTVGLAITLLLLVIVWHTLKNSISTVASKVEALTRTHRQMVLFGKNYGRSRFQGKLK